MNTEDLLQTMFDNMAQNTNTVVIKPQLPSYAETDKVINKKVIRRKFIEISTMPPDLVKETNKYANLNCEEVENIIELKNIISKFNDESVYQYPNAQKTLPVYAMNFNLDAASIPPHEKFKPNAKTTYISPYGMEIKTLENFKIGALLKIYINMPHYWSRKQKLVQYKRVDCPESFRVIGRVIHKKNLCKYGKKKLILIQTLVIDEEDEQVLKSFLEE